MTIDTRNFAIVPNGLADRGFGVLATGGTAYIQSPYARLAGRYGNLSWQGGLKYFRFADPATDGFTTGPGPAYAPVRAADLDRRATTYDIWLPTLGLSYDIDPQTQLYGSWGKGFIRPYSYLPLVNTYSINRAGFLAAGVTLADLFAGYDPEESETLDLGLRYRSERFEVLPTIFYAKYNNLLTTVSDPRVIVAGVPINYQQNIGAATGYGMEPSMNLFLSDRWTFYLNPTFTSLTYDSDLSFQGRIAPVEGNQIVDTPEWLARAGVIYSKGGFEIVPTVRYQGRRYGNATHTERVGDSLLVDLAVGYSSAPLLAGKTLEATLELSNLLDERTVAVVNASDDNQGGNPSYYPGAPFAVMLTVGIEL